MSRTVRLTLTAAGIFLLQWLIVGRLRIFGAYPDVVLLFLAWYALHEGRRRGALVGFALGLAMDVAYGTWGTHMFVKTLLGFVMGLFTVQSRTELVIQPHQAVLASFFIALLHNGLVVAFLALQTEVTTSFLLYGLWLGSALYTAVVGGIGSLFTTQ